MAADVHLARRLVLWSYGAGHMTELQLMMMMMTMTPRQRYTVQLYQVPILVISVQHSDLNQQNDTENDLRHHSTLDSQHPNLNVSEAQQV